MNAEVGIRLTSALYDASPLTAELLIAEAWEKGQITSAEADALTANHARVHAQLVQKIGGK